MPLPRAGLNLYTLRTGVDPELGAVVRHHVYPRKKLYVPTEDDIQRYPTMLPQRVTEIDGRDNICDCTADSGATKQKDWWTGRTYFPIVESDLEEFRLAVAARKGRPTLSRTLCPPCPNQLTL